MQVVKDANEWIQHQLYCQAFRQTTSVFLKNCEEVGTIGILLGDQVCIGWGGSSQGVWESRRVLGI